MTDIDSYKLKQQLLSLGNVVRLSLYIDPDIVREAISSYKEHFKPYNPRKPAFKRYGLSITSLDGGFSGVPDLDSLYEYNQIHGTHYNELDFRKWTPFFENCYPLKTTMKLFHKFMGRSHILRLDKGGFFPPHRDLSDVSFRLFIPFVENYLYVFMLDNKPLFFERGRIYFLNTILTHSLFSFEDNSLFAVFNIDLTAESVRTIFQNLQSF